MSRERLLFKGVTEIVGADKLGLILLTDEAEQRQLSIVCDRPMVQQIVARMEHLPIAERFLPEVLWQVVRSRCQGELELLINGVRQGQYTAVLYATDNFDSWLLRASDALLLSLISGLPLYIESSLMERQSVPYKKGAAGVTLPLNAITAEMIEAAMQKAIDGENYELASQLRDELQRRRAGKGGPKA